jgi:hypothetical protein
MNSNEGVDMPNGKIEYLGMVQSTIDRMSTTSAILKGFAATVITGISAISFTEINKWVLLLSVLPVFSFFALDIYYLILERKFRFLYNQIRTDSKEIDFSMNTDINGGQLTTADARIRDCIKSPSIWLFYLPAIIIVVAVVYMKFGGVI